MEERNSDFEVSLIEFIYKSPFDIKLNHDIAIWDESNINDIPEVWTSSPLYNREEIK